MVFSGMKQEPARYCPAGFREGAAARWIADNAEERVAAEARSRVIEIVETELLSLHEGNIARYRLQPAKFAAWKKIGAETNAQTAGSLRVKSSLDRADL